MILEPEHSMSDLIVQMEPRSMFAIQGDQISAEDHVVADKNLQAGTYLYRHGTVVCRTQAQSRPAVRRILIRQLQDAEERRAITAERKLLFPDGYVTIPQRLLKRFNKL